MLSVEITETPGKMSLITVRPCSNGASTAADRINRMTAGIFAFGMGQEVLTLSMVFLRLDTRMVEVRVRMGFVDSHSAYFCPRLQPLPETDRIFPPFITTRSGQPRGHTVQINFLIILGFLNRNGKIFG